MSPLPRVVVAGGSGFLGRALSDALCGAGHHVVVLTRSPGWASASVPPAPSGAEAPSVRLAHWTPDGSAGPWAGELEAARAVVNLAGESIGERRWTPARKLELRESRMAATRSLVAAIRACRTPPSVFVSASAVGYYGSRDDQVLTEDSPPGEDFLARLCVDWEQAALAAKDVTRVVLTRTGLVLDASNGALPRMIAPIRLFVGGPIGSGRQYVSWIHRDDWVALALWAIQETNVAGAVNATSSQPVTNAEFTRAAAALLHRPAVMPVPAFAVRMLAGEMGEALVVGGQRVVPKRALELGFRFRYQELALALGDLLNSRT